MARVDRNPAFTRQYFAENGQRWQEDAGAMGQAAIQAAAPVETGELVASVTHHPMFDPDGSPAVRYNIGADHAVAVDQGTGIYGKYGRRITPRQAKVLSWLQDGRRVFAKSTRGQPGQHYIRTGLRAVFSTVIEHLYGK